MSLWNLSWNLSLVSGSGGGAKPGEGFDVTKSGDARVGLIGELMRSKPQDWLIVFKGFPSVGKSTLLTKLTGTFSEAANYEFTTVESSVWFNALLEFGCFSSHVSLVPFVIRAARFSSWICLESLKVQKTVKVVVVRCALCISQRFER